MTLTTKRGLSVHISLFIAPENVSRFFEAFKPVYEKTLAEPECLFIEAYLASDDPGHIRLVENWDASVEFLKARSGREEFKDYFAFIETLFVKPRRIEVFNRLDGFYAARE
ncbi:hypothetical protein JDV02_006580 [Purpureocillium takamizusanense]|uniref:ABM domain-containing protein n=1 Tax=Purpureocillium takamizusanense TaxID=2060973 RepID=A0A9Q8QIV1_9HYPO|nr:uncharacterized protein JDV02_006580 [Purpureocillium takamizusanense]UNI20500.1 hypothetical protein JDV02_006580 [Purpureocillium takamizusanense]